ncbi:excisionase family DNA binding protein [Luteococcus japonicus]|uniref:Excisionase family DNA binding protein n=1 Tax=Luteococcus japonicus TaxID=33984 RepID=A0A3N1ZYG8_9ACTN|nr:excisionase family DNA binding protein [Luteococcus japonicus]
MGDQGPGRGRTRGNAEFISIKDAAELLAVSEVTIRRMIRRGELHGYRVGRRLILLRVDELEGHLSSRVSSACCPGCNRKTV